MVKGNELWNNKIKDKLVDVEFSKRTVQIFENAPHNLYQILKNVAYEAPNKVFIIDDFGNEYTFLKLLAMTDAFAEYLKTEYNVLRKSRVALMMYNSIEFCVSVLSIIKIGAICIPLPTKYKESETTSLINKSNPQVIICDEDFSSLFKPYIDVNLGTKIIFSKNSKNKYGFLHLVLNKNYREKSIDESINDFNNVAFIMYTSGTTSESKGVEIRNYSISHAIISYQRIFNISCKDSSIIPIPIYHVTGLIALFGLFLYCKGTIYLHRKFNAKRILEEVYKNNITFLHGSPTVFSILMKEKGEFPILPSLRCVACGSSNMPKQKIIDFGKWLPNASFYTVYGLTETASPATILPENAIISTHIGSSGYPIPGLSLKIVGDGGKELSYNQVGEICLSGTVVLQSYYGLETDALNNGWFNTGDLGYLSDDNYLYVVDRKKDMINRGGEKIWSIDVENEIYKIDGVQEAAVVGIPDETYGEVPVAVVELQSECIITPTEIQQILKNKIAHYKVPVKVIITKMPLTSNSKINKNAIRKLFL